MRTSSSALDAPVLLAADAWIARPESHDLSRYLRTDGFTGCRRDLPLVQTGEGHSCSLFGQPPDTTVEAVDGLIQ
jgi:hypothetical protein